jgi:biotin synthase-like enzyme
VDETQEGARVVFTFSNCRGQMHRVFSATVAGANSVFYGGTLLTKPNADLGDDGELFAAVAHSPSPIASHRETDDIDLPVVPIPG